VEWTGGLLGRRRGDMGHKEEKRKKMREKKKVGRGGEKEKEGI
jgi:hypothetical protein